MASLRDRGQKRAADRQPGSYSAGVAFERQRSFVLANALALGALTAATVVLSAAIWFLSPGGPGARGFAAGLSLAATIGVLIHWVSIASGASQATMGQVAEEWTATELRRLRRKGWRTVNNVMFRTWDVDHIAVGPDGVIVVETKWRSGEVDLDDPDNWLTAAAERLHRNERDVAGHLQWGARKDARITSVLVVWGAEIDQCGDEPIESSHGVNVLAGRHLRRNLDELGDAHLTTDEINTIYDKLLRQARSRDQHPGSKKPTLRETANRWLWTIGAGLVGAMVALLALQLGWWFFGAAAVFAAGGVLAARTPAWRAPGLAWLIGTQSVTLIVVVWMAVEAVQS